jgi:F-type H+-transporting ATPase subunit b
MPQLDFGTYASQVVWLVATFVAMLVLMWKAVVPRIADVLEARQKRIEDGLERAAELKREAEEAMAAYEKALAEARQRAHAALAQAQAALAQESAARERELAAQLAKKIADGEAAVRRARDEAIAGVRGVALEVVAAAAEKVAGEAFDRASVGAAVDAALGARA